MENQNNDLPLILDSFPLESEVEILGLLTDAEKLAWYKGFSRCYTLLIRAMGRQEGVFRLPQEQDALMELLSDRLTEILNERKGSMCPTKEKKEELHADSIDVLKHMSSRDLDIRLSKTVVSLEKDPRGGVLTMGIDSDTLNRLLEDSDNYAINLLVFNKSDFQSVEKSLNGKEANQ